MSDYKTTIDYNWQDQAACKSMSLKLFFIKNGEKISDEVVDACNSCPVRQACLNHALRHEGHGYWGGTSEKQRKRLRKELGISYRSPEADVNAEMAREHMREIMVEIMKVRANKGGRRATAQCGTRAGYSKHHRLGEVPCEPCREANRESSRKLKRERLEKRALLNG